MNKNKPKGIPSENMFRDLIERIPLPLCLVDNAGTIEFINERFTSVFGYTLNDIPTLEEWWVLAYPDESYREWVLNTWNDVVKQAQAEGKDIESIVYTVTCKSGDMRQIIISGITTKTGFLATFLDVTDQKRAEQELKQSEERYRMLTELAQDSIFLLDRDYKVQFVNDYAAGQFRSTKSNLVGKSIMELFPPKMAQKLKRSIDKVFDSNEPYFSEEKIEFPGVYRWLNTSLMPVRDPKGMVTNVLGISRDVTANKIAEEERDRFFNLTLDMLCIAGTDGYFKRLNPMWEKVLGFTREELMASPFIDFVHPGDVESTLTTVNQLSAQKPVINFVNRYRCKDGSYRWLHWASTPHDDRIYAAAHDVTELKEFEQSLKASEQKLTREKEYSDHLIDSLPGLFYQISPQGKFTRWNKNFKKVSHYSNNELTKLSPLDMFEGGDKKEIKSRIKEVFEVGHSTAEATFVSKKGTKTPYYFTGKRIMINDQPFLIGMGLDISDRFLAEEKVRLSEEKFRLAFDNAAIGKAMANLDGRFIKVNPGMCRLLGYDEEELLTKSWMDITHPEFLDLSFQMAGKLMKKESPSIFFDCRFLHKDGTSRWINLNIVLANDSEGNPLFFIADMVDISERNRVSEELKFRNQIVRKFLTVSEEEMFHDVLKIILDALESPYGVFGYIDQRGDLIVPSMTRHIWKECNIPEKDIVFPKETWGESSWPRAIREKQSNYTNELSSITPKGHIVVTRHITAPIIHQDIVVGLLQVANKETDYSDQDVNLLETFARSIAPILKARLERDVEDSRRTLAEKSLEEKVLELERSNKELEQFAYVASHDLQEPLRMVSSYTQLLEKRYKDKLDEDAHDFINFAVDGANRMQRLINDLLDYSRVTTRGNPFKKIDLSATLGHVIVNLQNKIIETSTMIVNDELPFVKGDDSQLIRLFQNLIENAIKFRGAESPRVTVKATAKDKTVTVSVQDNGIGIDEVYSDRIFTIFQRLLNKEQYPGTGIGLAICKRIVERHGGTIWFTSEEGKGTTFWFTLKQ